MWRFVLFFGLLSHELTNGCPNTCADVTYKVAFTNNWSKENHRKDFPDQVQSLIHWSNFLVTTHTSSFVLWRRGQLASLGVKNVCEFGLVTTLEADLEQDESGEVGDVLKLPGVWYKPLVGLVQPRSGLLTATTRHAHLSLITMAGPSPDWCVGVDALPLYHVGNCTWLEHATLALYPWDAGTDSGITYLAANSPTVPQEAIHNLNNTFPADPRSPFYGFEVMQPMAYVEIKKETEQERACTSDDQQTTDCDVTSWSPWSTCSATCGFSTRSRKRHVVQDSQAPPDACSHTQLEETTSCAGLPGYRPNCELPTDTCGVTNWSEWSPCSVDCGQGTRERTRLHMRQHDSVDRCGRQLSESDTCQANISDCQDFFDAKDYAAICNLASSIGPCRASFPRWYFDHVAKDCRAFAYGGCRGNENRFETREQCLQTCLSTLTSLPGYAFSSNCLLSPWTGWSNCSRSCGTGVRRKERVVLRQPLAGGKPCPSRLFKLRPCNRRPCEDSSGCRWSAWTPWTPCSHVTCIQERFQRALDGQTNVGGPQHNSFRRHRTRRLEEPGGTEGHVCGRKLQRRHCFDGPCVVYED